MPVSTPRKWSGPNRTGRTQVNMADQVGRRLLHVSRTEDLAPRYRRVYLTGDDLKDGFPYVRFAPTDHVKVVFPDPVTGVVTLPTPGRGLRGEDGAPKPVFRDYTVRAWLPETRELVIEFVLHGEGVGGRWAAGAKPGDVVGVLGPRGNIVFPEDYPRYVLVGDESALPAIGRFVEELPEGSTAAVVMEARSAADALPLASRPGVDVRWVARDAEGEDGLARAIEVLADVDEGTFAFVAGEVGKVRRARDVLLALGLPRERLVADGYWKRGVANLDHHSVDLNVG
jgi:NADPH-dependent ferric siderophore reductase